MTIENGIPLPLYQSRITNGLMKLKPGQSSTDLILSLKEQQDAYRLAGHHGIRIKTKKLDHGGWRVWRIQ